MHKGIGIRVSGEKPKNANDFVTKSHYESFLPEINYLTSDQTIPLDPAVSSYLKTDIDNGLNRVEYKLFIMGSSTAVPSIQFWLHNSNQDSKIVSVDLLTAKLYKPTAYDVGGFSIYSNNKSINELKSFNADANGIIVIELDYFITANAFTDILIYMNCIHNSTNILKNSFVKIQRNI